MPPGDHGFFRGGTPEQRLDQAFELARWWRAPELIMALPISALDTWGDQAVRIGKLEADAMKQ